MKCIETKKGGFLVMVNQRYGCYTDEEGNFRRSVDDIEEEVNWATEKWENKEVIVFPFEEILMKQLEYVQEYKESLVAVEE